ncbi:MAG TPA: zf-HC2 domain-containing protein, partial [Bacillota bacterium]|nr:zf-HC2 domain-containing protein [Bacillota bacterium]
MAHSETHNLPRGSASSATPNPNTHLAGNELRLMDYLAGQLPAEETQAIAAHLAACPECRALCDQWQQLEARLESGLKRPVLSSDFSARLRQRIQAESVPVAARSTREQLQAELEASWAQYRKRFLRAQLPGLLDGLGYGLAAAVGGYFLFH